MNLKAKKITLFLLTGLIPVGVFAALLFLEFPLIGAITWSALTGLILALSGHWLLSTNPWINAIEDKRALIIDVNSTGIAGFFVARIEENKTIGGIDIVMPNNERRSFSREMMHLLAAPKKAIMKIIQKDDKEKIVFEIDKDDFTQTKFSKDYLSIFFYNSQTGMFLTKPQIAETEKRLMIDYITMNEWREVKELGKTMRDFMRFTIDAIMDRFSAIFNNPLVKIIIVVIVLIIIIYIAIQVLPGIQQFLFPTPTTTPNGQVATPLPTTITPGTLPEGV